MVTPNTFVLGMVLGLGALGLGTHASAATPATNAPAWSANGNPPSTADPGVSDVDRAAAAEVSTGAPTIKMLLELQENKPGLENGDRSLRPTDRADLPPPRRVLSAPGAAQLAGPPPSPFEGLPDNARPPSPAAVASPSATAVDWNASNGPSPAEEAAANARPVQPGGGDGSRGAWIGAGQSPATRPTWITATYRFVRDNREVVFGSSLAALVLVWLTAAKAGRKG